MVRFERFAAIAAWIVVVGLTFSIWADEPAAGSKSKAKSPAKAKAAKKADKDDSKPGKTGKKVVRLVLNGDYPEGPGQPGLFADLQPSLASICEKLSAAAEDKAVAAVWLRIDDLEIGRGKINELRANIAKIRKAGKPIYAELVSADAGAYLLAAACDRIVMPPSGTLMIPGVRAEMSFYKDLLDKLGLKFDGLHMGKFKGAAEPFTRSTMSAPLRESLEALVDDAYEQFVDDIGAGRNMKDYQVKTLIDQGIFTASMAEKAGLIDEVQYSDQFESSLAKLLKTDKVEVVTNYKKKQVDTDFTGIGGLMKLMEVISGGKPSETSSSKQKIALVYAVGTIIEGKSTSDMFGESAMGSTTMVETLQKALDDPKVVAVVLRIDSPGGSATASDLIWRQTVRTKKPVIASMGNVAGSGGYYIAMGARKIIAEPSTLTGSIGVVGGKLVTGGLFDKVGINTEIISRGKNSGMFSSNQPFAADERKVMTALMEETYHEFVGKAASGRKMDFNKLEALAQGRVYTGRMAKKLGLVDELGTLDDAIAAAKKAAGMKADADLEIMVLPKPKTVFEQLFGADPSAADEMVSLKAAMPEVAKLLGQSKLWRQLLSEKTLLWMPYGIELK